MTTIFVYGTLLLGLRNHHVLGRTRLIGLAATSPAYQMFDYGSFPALCEGGTTSVKGELYYVDQRTIARLDRLEGHPHFYERKHVRLQDGRNLSAYLMPASRCLRLAPIPDGDWRAWIQHHEAEEPPKENLDANSTDGRRTDVAGHPNADCPDDAVASVWPAGHAARGLCRLGGGRGESTDGGDA